MVEQNVLIGSLAIVAVVAMMSVFGMITVTGYASKNVDRIKNDNLKATCIMHATSHLREGLNYCQEIERLDERKECIGKYTYTHQLEVDRCLKGDIGIINPEPILELK